LNFRPSLNSGNTKFNTTALSDTSGTQQAFFSFESQGPRTTSLCICRAIRYAVDNGARVINISLQ
jgi:hypothetical protein